MSNRAFALYVHGPLDASAATAELTAILIGPVHRLVWADFLVEHDREARSPLEARIRGHRRRACERLKESIQALFVGKEPERRIAILADWWMQAALGTSPLGTAWRVEEDLPSWLGRPLRLALDSSGRSPALLELHRPSAFNRARARLREQADHHQSIKKSPGPEIYKEARDDAYELLRLAEDPSRPAPTKLRLLDADVEEWASEPRNDEELIPQSPVWNNLVKHLRQFQEKANAVRKHWTNEPERTNLLPPDYSEKLELDFAPHADLARALVYDVTRLSAENRIPDMLRPAWLLERLATIPASVTSTERVRLLALAHEALDADPSLTSPDWVGSAESELGRIAEEITSLEARAEAGARDAKTWLIEAREHLETLDASQAFECVQIARQEIESAEREHERSRIFSELTSWRADLSEFESRLPADFSAVPLDALRDLHKEASAIRTARIKEATARLDELGPEVSRLALGEDRAGLEARLRDAKQTLRDGAIRRARELINQLGVEVAKARQAEEQSLGPELAALADRARRSPTRGPEAGSIEHLIRRIRARAAAKLPHQNLTEGLVRLIDALERDRTDQLPILGIVAPKSALGTVVAPLAYLDTGVAIDSARLSWTGELVSRTGGFEAPQGTCVRTGGVGAWYRKPPRQDAPSEFRREPEVLDDVTFVRPVYSVSPSKLDEAQLDPPPGAHAFFVEDDGRVLGPYTFLATGIAPADPRGFVAALPSPRFFELFGRVETSPKSVHEAPSLDELVAAGAEVVDVDDAVARERWLADMLEDLSGIDVASLSRMLERLGGKRPLPRPILARRVKDLENVLEASRLLGRERRRAAERFLSTEEGRREVERAAVKSVETRRAEIERDVEALRAEKTAELDHLDSQIRAAREQLAAVSGEEAEIRAAREEKLQDLRRDIEAAEELLTDRKARLLAQLVGSRKSLDPPAPMPEERIEARPAGTRSGADARAIVNRIAAQLTLEPQDAANILASVLSGPWTLLAGPPGAGKSTLARGFLGALGHGPGTDRYLELVVRRDWQDDAALFGFFHPEQRAWVPGSEGLLDWLLRAEDDRNRELGGLYAAVLEELNLASPEYYLSRLISALEARDPLVRLYGDDLTPLNRARYPSTFTLGPNVRLLGTVNVDETVERLSPRFLSRASVIWVEPELGAILRPSPSNPGPSDPIDYAELHDLLVPREPLPLGPIEEVVSFLHERRIPGAPSTRALTAVRRYLAASRGLLSDAVARDFAVVQRILPSFRGVGPRYGLALEDLSRLLRKHGFLRSAERSERLRQRGAELGEFYDFFHA